MTAHAVLSASASKRWLTCTPSARLEATLPELKKPAGSFDYSQEGTMAHSLAEVKLRHHYGQIGFEEYSRECDIIKANVFKDNRGYFSEILKDYGFAQINMSWSIGRKHDPAAHLRQPSNDQPRNG